MKYVLVTTLGLVLFFATNAEARNTGSDYHIYGYGGNNNGSNYRHYNRGGTNRYEGYSNRGYSHRSSGRRSYYNGGRTSIQRYNDPTGDRWVEVRPARLPLPSGNYGKASNRLTYWAQ